MTDSILQRPLREIAALVHSGEVRSADLGKLAHDKARKTESLNIFTALSEAPDSLSEGPLAGIPFAAKDAIDSVALKTCAASPALKSLDVPRDAEALERLQNAGATLVGKTNMHELSFGVTSNNAAFGPVRNPYDTDRIAGGSSGGSAAAVAVGAAAFAMAADTGGSARIPAALCGLVGFRPTTGRWPDAGLIKVSPTRDSLGVIVRHVDDALLIDTVLTGDNTNPGIPNLRDLRFALLTDPYMQDIDPEVAGLVEVFVQKIRVSGADVTLANTRAIHDLEADCGFVIALSEARTEMTALAKRVGFGLEELVRKTASPDVRGILTSLADMETGSDYERAIQITRPALQDAYETLFDSVDAILIPATPLAAARIGEDEEVTLNGTRVPTFPTYARNTSPASVAGIPSVTLPIGRTSAGLPVGLLIEARARSDRRLLSIAASLETITPPLPLPVLR